jgi:small GTP-binding protein
MPVNAGVDYLVAEKRYSEARTTEEKIKALEEMIRTSPKHKGAQNLLAELRRRLAKLKKEAIIEKRKSKKSGFRIRKEGSAQICIIGLTNSGKSTLLNSLTNAHAKVAEYSYTTKEPNVGMMFYNDLQFQIIEMPSTFDSKFLSLLHSCDMILMLLDSTQNSDNQKEQLMNILKENKVDAKNMIFVKNKCKTCRPDRVMICIDVQSGLGIDGLKEKIWKSLDLIKVYTKSPGKSKAIPAIAMKKNSTVEDFTKEIHRDFTKTFKFAKIFNSTKFSGKRVGLVYKLQDNDTVEIHTE